jgi:hypothetical protein
MLISDRKKFIFIHIPKTGGMTVRDRLMKYEDRKNFYFGFSHSTALGKKVDKAHLPYLDFLSYEDSKYLNEYFVFCFVRNPYDRFYSAFIQHKHMRKLPDSVEFNSYVLEKLDNIRIRYDFYFSHFCPQPFFTHYKKKCIPDFIGRCENFENDFIRLEQILDVKIEKKKSVNRRDKEDGEYKYIKYFKPETINLVNNLYKDDFMLFNYRMITLPEEVSSTATSSSPKVVYAEPKDYISYLNAIKIDALPSNIVMNEKFSFEGIAVPKDNNTHIKEIVLELPNKKKIIAERGFQSPRYGEIYPQVIGSENCRFKFSDICLSNHDAIHVKVLVEDDKLVEIAQIIPS